MHVIKTDNFYFAFNKKEAINVMERLKNKRLCVLDFEAFQFYSYDKDKFSKITINDIPYTVCLNTMTFDEVKNCFVSEKELIWQFQDDWKTEDDLLKKLEQMAVVVANYVKENEIDCFIFMAKYLEKEALNFFVENFSKEIDLKTYLRIKDYDLYNFYFNDNNYKILSYEHKTKDLLNMLMAKYGDEYHNYEIGGDGLKHFKNHIRGKKEKFLDFEKVKDHSANDLKKGVELLNYIYELSTWPDHNIENAEQLKKENNL